MAVTLEIIHNDMQKIKDELSFLLHLVAENYELSDGAKQKLKKARLEMDRGDYISHEEMMAKYA